MTIELTQVEYNRLRKIMYSNGLNFEHIDRKLINDELIYKKDGLVFQSENINISDVEIVDCIKIIQYNEKKYCNCAYCFSCNACDFYLEN